MNSDQTQDQIQEPSVTQGAEPVLPPYLAYVGINQAARLVGKGKQQIYRDIEAGKLSWHVGGDGKKQLQIVDLDRVYNLKPQVVTGSDTSHQNHKLPPRPETVTGAVTTDTAIELAILQERLRGQAEIMRRMEQEINDLRQNRDQLLEHNQRITMLLPAPALTTPAPEPIAPPEQAERKSFWKRLFS